MIYKGLIMEVQKDCIIVLTDSNNYLKLKKKSNIDIGKKIMFIEEDIIKKQKKSIRPLIGIAAAIILLITTVIGQYGMELIDGFNAYAIVSVDINPSLEFQIDKKEIVKKIKALNNDGEELLDEKMIGMKIEEAILYSIKTAFNKKYINNANNVVLISEMMMDNKEVKSLKVMEDKINEKIDEDEEIKDINLIYIQSDKEDLKKARENKVSIGKYEVYKVLSNNNSNLKIEDIKDKKVSDIVKENKDITKDKRVKVKKEKKEEEKHQDEIENRENKLNEKQNEVHNKNGKKPDIKTKQKDINSEKNQNEKNKETNIKNQKIKNGNYRSNKEKHNNKNLNKTKNDNKDFKENNQKNEMKNYKGKNKDKKEDNRNFEKEEKDSIRGKVKNDKNDKFNKNNEINKGKSKGNSKNK
ncbi:anti-sigma factor domain-containing protein [Maledivibacter halophilus]|uniref:Anti-sigma factor N-terminus n=1 Tax=Maledivibacter halophilus TaxID=36842 RepID=A0A1T5MBK0_9FIRM|nr:anti-sigma factor domain-containing protein [Maledivibacter halophilus]SKC85617.1 Anti-sigma factor N-terminus [Maledivibacter halophilus]